MSYTPPPPDFATWHREGAGDGDSGGFNYVTDRVANHGDTVTYDNSSGWVTAYGYPSGQVLEAGVYFFRLRNAVPSGTPTPNMSFYDTNASPLTVPQFLAGLPGGDGTAADWIAVLYLPAGAHFEASYGTTISELTVTRVL